MAGTLISGLAIGAIYALLAVALVLTYRTSRVINLAQGDTGTAAAFLYYALVVEGTWSVPAGVVAALLLAVTISLATYGLIVRWLGARRETIGLVATLGLATAIQLVAGVWSDGAARFFPQMTEITILLADLRVSGAQIAILLVALGLAVGLGYVFRTVAGLRLRAVGEDGARPRLLGVRTHRVSAYAWVAAGGISGVSALLVAQVVRFEPSFMFALLLPALVAALAAGLSSAPVAVVVALGLGLAQTTIQYRVPVPGLDVVALLVFAIVIISRLRPVELEAR